MILTGYEIRREYEAGRIKISPFNPQQINPNSYDFRLGKVIKTYKNKILDPKVRQETDTIMICDDGFTLYPDKIYMKKVLTAVAIEILVVVSVVVFTISIVGSKKQVFNCSLGAFYSHYCRLDRYWII